ncbi:MAG: DNA polymerase III subunit gamma/tau [Candidatus Niyogibacteria bacterium]|nr:DNA polymerase III subunit gamma/tau [Candidatus Niyogibacteria bacterium]
MAGEFVLYRKYRPQTFGEVFGQEHVVTILQSAIAKNRVAHAYLFSGPRGSGKTSIARIFARAVSCANIAKSSTPCNTCENCKEFQSGQTLDLIEIDAASNRGIDEVRALKEAALTLPFKSPYKVYIIDEVHMMTKEAFNALLKLLEEPPKHVIFIMATTEAEKVPETISSRTQHLRFHPLPEHVIAKALMHVAKKEGMTLEKEVPVLVSFLADGSLRDAFNFLHQIGSVGGKIISSSLIHDMFGVPPRKMVYDMIDAIHEKNREKAFRALSELPNNSASASLFLRQLLRNFRHLFLLSYDNAFAKTLESMIEKDEYHYLAGKKGELPAGELRNILATFLYTANMNYKSPYPSLPLELALSKIFSVLEKEQ